MRRAAAALGLTLALATAAPAAADHTLTLDADIRERGYVGLRLHAAPGSPVTLRDDATGTERTLTPSDADSRLRRFATWTCSPRVRRFSAVQGPLTATAEVRIPSCARRFELLAPRRVRAGSRVAATLRDSWRLGGQLARFCVRGPGTRQRCRRTRLQAGSSALTLRFRDPRPGRYRLSVRTPHQLLGRTVHANPPDGRLNILATGDSMIQIIDSYLEQRLNGRRTRVHSDARISTGISKSSLLDWQAHARRQAARRPDVVVMFIGANDGFPMRGRPCCGPAWIAEYARRARRMMRAYARGGRARVIWLLLPGARENPFQDLFPKINAGLRRAARGLTDDVRLIDLSEVFTPGGQYRERMEIGGREVKVRNGDGVHLSGAGASLTAGLIIRALRADGML